MNIEEYIIVLEFSHHHHFFIRKPEIFQLQPAWCFVQHRNLYALFSVSFEFKLCIH